MTGCNDGLPGVRVWWRYPCSGPFIFERKADGGTCWQLSDVRPCDHCAPCWWHVLLARLPDDADRRVACRVFADRYPGSCSEASP